MENFVFLIGLCVYGTMEFAAPSASWSCWGVYNDGEEYITNVQLLQNDSVLLTINEYSSTADEEYWCKEMDVETGSTSENVDCDDYDDSAVRAWSTGDIDPTTTMVQDVYFVNNTLTASMVRNGEQLYVNLSDTNETDAKVNSFQYFTVYSNFTTFLMVNTGTWTTTSYSLEKFALQFSGENSNDYEQLDVTLSGNSWNFWNSYTGDDDYGQSYIEVYESVSQLKLPIICCYCPEWFVAQFEMEFNSSDNAVELSLSNTMIGVYTDVGQQRAISWSEQSSVIQVYNLTDNSRDGTFSPDLSFDVSDDEDSGSSDPYSLMCSVLFGSFFLMIVL